MNMKISKLFKANERIVFYASDLNAIRNEYYQNILSGEYTCFDVYGEEMEPAEAAQGFLIMADTFKPEGYEEQIYRNIITATKIVSIVRTDMMKNGIGPEYLTILDPIIAPLMLGLFETVAGMLAAFPRDDFLTDERLNRWAEMVAVADAIVYP